MVWFMIPIYATGGQQSRRKIDCVAMLANLNAHVQYDEDSVGDVSECSVRDVDLDAAFVLMVQSVKGT